MSEENGDNDSEYWKPESGESLQDYRERMEKRTGQRKGSVLPSSVEKLRQEKEQLRDKLSIIAEQQFNEKVSEVKDQVTRKYGQSRAQDILSEIENPDLPMEQRIAKLQQTEVLLDSGGNGESGSGTIPFSRVNPEEKRGFDSPQAMMNFLMDMEARRGQQGKEAKAVLNELFLRKEKAMKETGKSFTVKIPTDEELAEGKGLKDILHEKWKRRQQRKEEVEE